MFAVTHTFLSFGCLYTTTLRTFATKADADAEAASLTQTYQAWREANPHLRSPVPSTFLVVEADDDASQTA